MGKTDISPPISESTWIAVSGFLLNPGTVLIKFKAASYLSLRRRISCSTSEMCLLSSSMWSRHCLSFTTCSFEMAPSTAACISVIGVLHLLSTKGAISNFSPGCCKICLYFFKQAYNFTFPIESHHLCRKLTFACFVNYVFHYTGRNSIIFKS